VPTDPLPSITKRTSNAERQALTNGFLGTGKFSVVFTTGGVTLTTGGVTLTTGGVTLTTGGVT
jgi:hypothetical protein